MFLKISFEFLWGKLAPSTFQVEKSANMRSAKQRFIFLALYPLSTTFETIQTFQIPFDCVMSIANILFLKMCLFKKAVISLKSQRIQNSVYRQRWNVLRK